MKKLNSVHADAKYNSVSVFFQFHFALFKKNQVNIAMLRIARNCLVFSIESWCGPAAQAGRRRRGISCFARPAFRRWITPRAGRPLTPRKMPTHFSVIKKIICFANYDSCSALSPGAVRLRKPAAGGEIPDTAHGGKKLRGAKCAPPERQTESGEAFRAFPHGRHQFRGIPSMRPAG